jgi:hypothetical protein
VGNAAVVAKLLQWDAILAAQTENQHGAILACLAICNAANSIGDEPRLDAQLTRSACWRLGLRTLERVLAQGEASDEDLACVQDAIQREDLVNLLLIASRGERAAFHEYYSGLQSGHLPYLSNRLDVGQRTYIRATLPEAHAWVLRFLTAYVEVAKRPSVEWEQGFGAMEDGTPPAGFRMLFSSLDKAWLTCFRGFQMHHATLRCSAVAVAAERFRKQHGIWPATLVELVPAKLNKIPSNPRDSSTMQLCRTLNGIIIRYKENDQETEGSNVGGSPGQSKQAISFRLWNVENRRQRNPKPSP